TDETDPKAMRECPNWDNSLIAKSRTSKFIELDSLIDTEASARPASSMLAMYLVRKGVALDRPFGA
ncbi:hypothetical protein, partial [Mesorhizobium japonicum]|uniref:hypothetical protein n=1 Tax=Mesorhizobium japonicum TaxID=2066070 RepID=UPI003B59004C